MSILEFINTYWYVIIGYAIYLVIYAIFVLVAFYHCWEYGYAGDASKVVMLSFVVICIIIVVFTFIFFFSL